MKNKPNTNTHDMIINTNGCCAYQGMRMLTVIGAGR